MVTIMAKVQKAIEYLEKTIYNLTTIAKTTIPQTTAFTNILFITFILSPNIF